MLFMNTYSGCCSICKFFCPSSFAHIINTIDWVPAVIYERTVSVVDTLFLLKFVRSRRINGLFRRVNQLIPKLVAFFIPDKLGFRVFM
jgi:hypothetical protein